MRWGEVFLGFMLLADGFWGFGLGWVYEMGWLVGFSWKGRSRTLSHENEICVHSIE